MIETAQFTKLDIEEGYHSAVASGYLESGNYKETMKRPKNERKMWMERIAK